jgi:serine/threonine-protein kinase
VESQDSRKQAIQRELELVLASTAFSRNERQSRFLRFLVEKSQDGRSVELKESVIAVEVFGRQAGYDPKLDGIVRTEAVRLRARLDRYYAAEGGRDPLVIELPKGGYRPVFRERQTAPTPATIRPVRMPWIAGMLSVLVVAVIGATWWARANSSSVTVAVLPLENLGHDPASDYFADGLTDEIIRSLSMIERVTVPSRTSSFALKGKQLRAGEAAKQLGVEYLVEGSVLQAGQQLRVNVALIRARDDFVLWSGRFDRELTDVFAIQDEISRGIVNGLRLKLNTGRRRYETNLEAYDLYLRGRQVMGSFPMRGQSVARRAVEYFDEALQKDPNYALALAGKADAFLAIDLNIIAPHAFEQATATAERATELDPMLSEAQSPLASAVLSEPRCRGIQRISSEFIEKGFGESGTSVWWL